MYTQTVYYRTSTGIYFITESTHAYLIQRPTYIFYIGLYMDDPTPIVQSTSPLKYMLTRHTQKTPAGVHHTALAEYIANCLRVCLKRGVKWEEEGVSKF